MEGRFINCIALSYELRMILKKEVLRRKRRENMKKKYSNKQFH